MAMASAIAMLSRRSEQRLGLRSKRRSASSLSPRSTRN
jgi:hypothetical protein